MKNLFKYASMLLLLMMLSTSMHANKQVSPVTPVFTDSKKNIDVTVANTIMDWLQHLQVLSASFVQINADGTKNNGRMDIVHRGTPKNGRGGKCGCLIPIALSY